MERRTPSSAGAPNHFADFFSAAACCRKAAMVAAAMSLRFLFLGRRLVLVV
jgi:hypothetical protein